MPAKDGERFEFRIGRSGRTIQVITAASPESLQRGLSGHPRLPPGEGMFFIFPTLDVRSMWMPEMRFPLDVIWLDEQLVIVHRNLNCPPCRSRAECPSYSSEALAKYAIEVTAGQAEALGLREGVQLFL